MKNEKKVKNVREISSGMRAKLMLLLGQEPCQGYDVSVDGVRWVD